jgi:hypothetical protein
VWKRLRGLVLIGAGLVVGVAIGYGLRPAFHWWDVSIQPGPTEPLPENPPPTDVRKLFGLPYVRGGRPATGRSGVTVYDRKRAHPGYNLYCSAETHAADLIDMEGRVLHSWRYETPQSGTGDWMGVHLFNSGDLLLVDEDLGLIRIDKRSKLLWRYDGGCHHDLEIAPDGCILVLTREVRHAGGDQGPVYGEEAITVLTADGKPLQRVSILEAFRRSTYACVFNRVELKGDVLHTNALRRLDGRLACKSPAFREGNVLISVREIDTIAVVDLETQRVVWALSGMWTAQHDPKFLPNGHILLFDNQGLRSGSKIYSKVLEFDPLTQTEVWAYRGSPANGFYSEFVGQCQRFANGNTLIVETDGGRAFEVTPAGETVWEFINPKRTGANQELRAAIVYMVRIPSDFPLGWLDRAGSK